MFCFVRIIHEWGDFYEGARLQLACAYTCVIATVATR